MNDKKAMEARWRLEKRQQLRENATCDAALSGTRAVTDWPCILWANHSGAHVYDTSVDGDGDLADLLAERDRLLAVVEAASEYTSLEYFDLDEEVGERAFNALIAAVRAYRAATGEAGQ